MVYHGIFCMVYHGEFSIEQVLFSEVDEVRINGADAFYTALLPTLTTSAQMTRSAWGRNKSVPGVRIRSAQLSSQLTPSVQMTRQSLISTKPFLLIFKVGHFLIYRIGMSLKPSPYYQTCPVV